MTNYASGIQASELGLVDDAPAPGDAPAASGNPPRVKGIALSKPVFVQVLAPSGDAPGVASNTGPALRLVDAPPAADAPAASGDATRVKGIALSKPVFVQVLAPSGDAPGVTSNAIPALRRVDAPASSGDARTVTAARTPARAGAPEIVIEVLAPREDVGPVSSAHFDARGANRAQPAARTTPRQTNRGRSVSARPNRKKVALVAGALGSLALGALIIVAGWVAMRSESAPAQQLSAPKAAPVAIASGPSTPAGQATSADANAHSAAHEDAPTVELGGRHVDFAGRLQALKSAGNWNVFVIYAGEWTRAQPGNPEAWRELSMGYVRLGQFRDARDAAARAVELEPGSFLAWQNLGKVNLALQESAAALAAFERAATLNDQDVISLVQAGMLDTRLGRLPEARIAFTRALAASPEDVDALCGAASVAQKEGRLKDAEAMTQQLKSLDGICRDPAAGESVRVAAMNGPTRSKTVSPTGR